MTTLRDTAAIPVVEDRREFSHSRGYLPFEFKRVYYLLMCLVIFLEAAFAHQQSEVLIALSGSFEVVLNDGTEKNHFY
jgi:hypothetical protein